MPHNNEQKVWEEYRERELRSAKPILERLGFVLDTLQPHTRGERFLMAGERDVGGGGRKLVLTGHGADGVRVIIKVSSDPEGKKEIDAERAARRTLHDLRFAYYVVHSPEEIAYVQEGGLTLFITRYIEQEKNFLERPLQEQFSLALAALKVQEGMHATTSSHVRAIRRAFGVWSAKEYLRSFAIFSENAARHEGGDTLIHSLARAQVFLEEHGEVIEQYCGFLTHADFVPHNLRVEGQTFYLLDYASLHFGNKYESWARFMNFMLLYNRPLEEALLQYVRDNRTPEEYIALRCMRIYKLGFLLSFYAESLGKTTGSVHTLSQLRLTFWLDVLQSLLEETCLSEERIEAYREARDQLRSPEEKERQKNLH